MSDTLIVSGMVLSAAPIGEYDKRVVILTRELGKISAFARGARRQNSVLMAASNPFVFGSFTVIAGRTSYNLTGTDIRNYFTELAGEMPGVYYGYYFLEFAGYYGREGLDATDMLNLLYLSMKALLNPSLDNRLVRRIFELRLMTINGEYAPETEQAAPGVLYTIQYIMYSPLEKLFTFQVKEEVLRELEKNLNRHMKKILDRPLKSREILEQITSR